MRMTRFPTRFILPFVIVVLLALYPLVMGTGGTTALLLQVFAFGAFAMSYDVLIGYTGVISFGHAMFFGTGAYSVGIWLAKTNGTTSGLLFGCITAIALSVLLSLFVSFLSLRVRDAYFAMITLAVGEVFAVLAASEALRPWTNAGDGFSVPLPMWLMDDKTVYYLGLVFLVVICALLVRFVRSPFGWVLQGIRENEPRMKSLGHRTVRYKTVAFIVSGIVAALSGALFAVAQSFVSTTVYDISTVSLNVLLMVVIGGTGTLYGGMLGAFLLLGIQTWLSNFGGSSPLLQNDYIVFGIIYILVVRFMPKGILGTVREWGGGRRWKTTMSYKQSKI